MNNDNFDDQKPQSSPLNLALPKGVVAIGCGLQIPISLSEQQTIPLIDGLFRLGEFRIWTLADLARHVLDREFVQAARELAEKTGRTANHIRSIAAVARAYPQIEDRNPAVSFAHHQVVYNHAPGAQDADRTPWIQCSETWLKRARDEGWSCKELKAAIMGSRFQARTIRDFGYDFQTKIGRQLATNVSGVLFRSPLSSADHNYAQNVIADVEHVVGAIQESLKRDSVTNAPSELTQRDQALDGALNQYLASQRSSKDFAAAAHAGNVKVRELGQYRLIKAAELKAGGISITDIERYLGVKAEKLKAYLSKIEKLAPAQQLPEEDSPTNSAKQPVSAESPNQTIAASSAASPAHVHASAVVPVVTKS